MDASDPTPPTASEAVACDRAQTGLTKGYLPVDVSLAFAKNPRDFDLYESVAGKMVLFCASGYELGKAEREPFTKRDSFRLYVPVSQGRELSQHTEGVLRKVLIDKDINVKRRADILYTAANTIMSDILAHPSDASVVPRAMRLSQNVVTVMLNDSNAWPAMCKLFSRDYYTFAHSVHTCVLGTMLYKYIVSSKADRVQRFGLAAILHDIGKTSIDPEILNKPGRLEASEFEQVKAHPEIGHAIMMTHGTTDVMVLDVVQHHHEKLNGKGYPQGLAAGEISDNARVAAIVDIYDALTTSRPYRDAMTHDQAIELMENEFVPDEIDAGYFTAFKEAISRVPLPQMRPGSDDTPEDSEEVPQG